MVSLEVNGMHNSEDNAKFQHSRYGRCSKISNKSCLSKRPRQTVQTQIRLLLKKQYDQGLSCLQFYQAFYELQP